MLPRKIKALKRSDHQDLTSAQISAEVGGSCPSGTSIPRRISRSVRIVATDEGKINSFTLIRDWSLFTGRGATKLEGGGGQVKFYPYEKKGGGRKRF